MPDASETPIESAAEESQQPEPQKEPEPEPEPKETVTVQGGRRRGKRKIMKKKTVKDDEGYLGKSRESSPREYITNTTSLSHGRRASLGIVL
jgi:DNA polymerase delta subunit 3